VLLEYRISETFRRAGTASSFYDAAEGVLLAAERYDGEEPVNQARYRLRDGIPRTVGWFLAQQSLTSSGPRS